MRSAFALVLTAASFFATVSAVPSAATKAVGTVVKVWPNGVTESTIPSDEYFGTVEKRQFRDLSGATCDFSCSGAPGTGPDQSDCNVITNQLLGFGTTKFTVDTTNNVHRVTFNSCRVDFVNLSGSVVVYQDNDFGSVASVLAGSCNAAHGFAQGRCTFEEANAFIEVIHS